MVLGDTVEAFENERQVFVGDADSVVPDADFRLLTISRHDHADHQSAIGGIFLQGIFDQIEKHLIPIESVTCDNVLLWDFQV